MPSNKDIPSQKQHNLSCFSSSSLIRFFKWVIGIRGQYPRTGWARQPYAGPFEELQIIKPELFDLAQRLMLERTKENKEQRTVPLNTTGQPLLSGNVFCGHCGGRLTLTTNGTVRHLVDGTPVPRKRVRYVCYNKTRRRQDCDGQTGYTMHILDDMVIDILHQVFDKMKGAPQEMIVRSTFQKKTALLQSNL